MNSQLNLAPKGALAALQQRYCIIDLTGEIRILDRAQIESVQSGSNNSDISFYKKPDGELCMRRYLESLSIPSKPKDVIADFWIDPSTLMYDKVAFTPKPTPPTTLNYWNGYTVKGTDGDWKPIGDYLCEVICDGDAPSHTYLLKFLAHMVQRPAEKPGVMLTLLGGQGTGKGVFFKLLRAIWTRTTLQVSDIDEVVGRFNAALERHYIICMDEAIFSGDRRSLDRLKSMVTEPVARIEQKYQPSRSIESNHRFFAASNHEHFAHIEKDDRRFLFLRVSDAHQQDSNYFEALCGAINDKNTLGGMVRFLENLDLTGFDVHKRPKTTEHSKQKLKSLAGFERYWHEVLCTGSFSTDDLCLDEWVDPVFKPTGRLLRQYREYDRQSGRYAAVQEAQVSELIKKMCVSATANRKMVSSRQHRGFDLPSIDTARTEFAEYLGCAIEWEEN
jgi:hypothetical protein